MAPVDATVLVCGESGKGASIPETVRVTFDDVAGIAEVEAEINELVDSLRPWDVPTARDSVTRS